MVSKETSQLIGSPVNQCDLDESCGCCGAGCGCDESCCTIM
ncbi:hypothetical protein RSAG8_03191, partial [Rhizoctonia solani AG-8 WAC10335]